MSLKNLIQKGKANTPPRLLVYGPEGIGKSTFGSRCPTPIFVPTEEGLNQIAVDKYPLARSLDEFNSYLADLAEDHGEYRTVVVDTLDGLENLVQKKVCADGRKQKISDFPYGQGYDAQLFRFREITAALDRLRDAGMIVLLLAHAKTEKINDPENGDYDCWSPRLYKTSNAWVREWVDGIFFAHRRMIVDSATRRAVDDEAGAPRMMRCVGIPPVVAKNRYNLPDEVPFSWQGFVENIGKGSFAAQTNNQKS